MLDRLTHQAGRCSNGLRRFHEICANEGARAAVDRALEKLVGRPRQSPPPAVAPTPVYEFPSDGGIPVFHPVPVDAEGRRREEKALHQAIRAAISFAVKADSVAGLASPRASAEIAHLLRHFCSGCAHAREGLCTRMPVGSADAPQEPFFRILSDSAGRCPVESWPAVEKPPVVRLNLAYYIFPARHAERVWQWNVGELLKRLDAFNGRRIVTIATVDGNPSRPGCEVDPPEVVMEAFAGHDVEFRLAPNDAEAQEAPHFIGALRELASTDASEALFYAHAKGVTRQNQRQVRAWTSAMYHHNLDRIDEVRDALRRWPCAGIGKHYGLPLPFLTGKPTQSWDEAQHAWHGWHFSGTFWWVRHDALFSIRDWDQVELYPYAPEKFLANFFRPEEAYCLSHDDIRNPHDPLTWHDLGVAARAA